MPDVVGNHKQTVIRWTEWHSKVRDIGYKPAFVLQDGATVDEVPWGEMDALFVGGTTGFKLSNEARIIVDRAKSNGKWVHMGRVNSKKRIRIAHEWGCDSVDGTFLAFGPDVNTPKLIHMVQEGTRPMLF